MNAMTKCGKTCPDALLGDLEFASQIKNNKTQNLFRQVGTSFAFKNHGSGFAKSFMMGNSVLFDYFLKMKK